MPQEELIVFGRSIGSIFAIHFAYRFPNIAGLIIDSGIDDPIKVFLSRVPIDKFKEENISMEDLALEGKKYFKHEEKLSNYKGKMLLLHTKDDSIIPVASGLNLFDWAKIASKEKVIFEIGGHAYIWQYNEKEYKKELCNFLASISPLCIDTRQNRCSLQ